MSEIATYLIIAAIALIVILALPVIIVIQKGNTYIKQYLIFLKNNRVYISAQDENLIRVLVKQEYKDTIVAFVIGFGLGGLSPIIPFIGIICLIIISFTFMGAFSKFERQCPYCHKKVNLSDNNCPRCTKFIGNTWTAKPILAQYHR